MAIKYKQKIFILCLSFFSLFGCVGHFNPLNYLGSKTPYSGSLKKYNKIGLEQCEVVHINHLARHGSRHMTSTDAIDELSVLLAQAQEEKSLQEPLGLKLIELVHRAKNTEKPEKLGQLSEQGKDEQRHIAERMYFEFQELFSKSSSQKALLSQSTHVQRAKDSQQAFWEKLIKLQPSLKKYLRIKAPKSKSCDPQLRFFDGCKAYQSYKHEHSYEPLIEEELRQQALRVDINKILSRFFTHKFLSKIDNKNQIKLVYYIYNLCQLDANINKNNLNKSFCTLFQRADELEYFNQEEDMTSYFSKGFGGSAKHIAHTIACPLVADFVATSEQAIRDPKNAPRAHMRFAHAETIIPFLVHLGLYQEDSIVDILERPSKRKFRTALVSPMAANVQWILYKCPENQYRVRMLHNEKKISFPIAGCENKFWCDWQKIKDYINEKKLGCSEEEWRKDICLGTSC